MALFDFLRKAQEKEQERQSNPLANIQGPQSRIASVTSQAPNPSLFQGPMSTERGPVLNTANAQANARTSVPTVLQGTPLGQGLGALERTTNVAGTLAQGLARAVPEYGLGIVQAVAPQATPRIRETPITRTVFGPGDIRPIQTETAELGTLLSQSAQQAGASRLGGDILGGAAVLGLGLADIPSGGRASRLAREGAETLLERAAQQTARRTDDVLETVGRTSFTQPSALQLPQTQAPDELLGRIRESIPRRATLPEVADTVDIDAVVAREVARQTAEAPKTPIKERVSRAYSKVRAAIDKRTPIEDIVTKYEDLGDFNATYKNDIRRALSDVERVDAFAEDFVRREGLSDAVQSIARDLPEGQVAKEVDRFNQYLIAKQGIDVLADRNPNINLLTKEAEEAYSKLFGGRVLKDDIALVKQLEPRFSTQATQIRNYSQKLLDLMTNSGLISQDTSRALKKKFPNYVPLNRVFTADDITADEVAANIRSLASVREQDIIKELKGSERAVAAPLESLIERTQQVIAQAKRNQAAQIMGEYRNLPENPFNIERLSGKTDEAVRNMVKAAKADGKDVFYAIENGKSIAYSIDKEYGDVLKNVGIRQRQGLAALAARFNRIRKVGITGLNPAFIVSNFPRDVASLGVQSRAALTDLVNPVNWFRVMSEIARGRGATMSKALQDAALSTSFDFFRNPSKQTLSKLVAERSPKSKFIYNVKNPSEFLRAVEDFVGKVEQLPRLKEYKAVYDQSIARGLGEEEARSLATRAAREATTDFLRSGTWSREADSYVMFLQAGINSKRRFLQAFRENPVKASARFATTVMIPLVGVTAWNMRDEESRELYSKIRDYEKEGNFLILLPGAYYNKDKGRVEGIVKVPSFMARYASPVRKWVEQAFGEDPVGAKDFFETALYTVSPLDIDTDTPEDARRSLLNSLIGGLPITPMIERQFNEDLFTGAPKIPEYMLDLPKEQQVRPDTSFTARRIAALTNMSPIEVENLIGEFGGAGQQLLNAIDSTLVNMSVAPEGQVGGRSVIEDVQRRLISASAGQDVDEAITRLEKVAGEKRSANAELRILGEEIDRELANAADDATRARIYAERVGDDEDVKEAVSKAKDKREKNWSYDEVLIDRMSQNDGTQAKAVIGEINERYGGYNNRAYDYIMDLYRRDVLTDKGFAILLDRMLLDAPSEQARGGLYDYVIKDRPRLRSAVKEAKKQREED